MSEDDAATKLAAYEVPPDLAQHQDAAVLGELPTIEAGDDGLAMDR